MSVKQSHIKLLNDLKVNIESLHDGNIRGVFDQLRDERPKLTDNYKISILSTIKTLNQNVKITYSKLGLSQRKMGKITGPLVKNITVTVVRMIQEFRSFTVDDLMVTNMRHIETVLASCVCLCTRVPMAHFQALHYAHVAHQTPYSFNRKRFNVKAVEPLYSVLMPVIDHAMLLKRHFNFTSNPLSVDENALNEIPLDAPLITVRADAINKTLRDLYLRFIMETPTTSLGLIKLKYVNANLLLTMLNSSDNVMFGNDFLEDGRGRGDGGGGDDGKREGATARGKTKRGGSNARSDGKRRGGGGADDGAVKEFPFQRAVKRKVGGGGEGGGGGGDGRVVGALNGGDGRGAFTDDIVRTALLEAGIDLSGFGGDPPSPSTFNVFEPMVAIQEAVVDDDAAAASSKPPPSPPPPPPPSSVQSTRKSKTLTKPPTDSLLGFTRTRTMPKLITNKPESVTGDGDVGPADPLTESQPSTLASAPTPKPSSSPPPTPPPPPPPPSARKRQRIAHVAKPVKKQVYRSTVNDTLNLFKNGGGDGDGGNVDPSVDADDNDDEMTSKELDDVARLLSGAMLRMSPDTNRVGRKRIAPPPPPVYADADADDDDDYYELPDEPTNSMYGGDQPRPLLAPYRVPTALGVYSTDGGDDIEYDPSTMRPDPMYDRYIESMFKRRKLL